MARYYFHGSQKKLDVGLILKGCGQEYINDWKNVLEELSGDIYEKLEKKRPFHCIAHSEAVFMCSMDAQNTNNLGLDDIHICGGKTDYYCQVLPDDAVYRYDQNWLCYALQYQEEMTLDNVEKITKSIDKCIDGYWSGKPSPFEKYPLWEYLTRSAMVLDCKQEPNYNAPEDFEPFLMSRYQMMEYMNDNENYDKDSLKYVFTNYEEQYFIVIEKQNEILGTAVIGKSKDDLVLYGISVSEKQRNKGLAKKMLDLYFNHAEKLNLKPVLSSYSEDGEKYLKKYIEEKTQSYSMKI